MIPRVHVLHVLACLVGLASFLHAGEAPAAPVPPAKAEVEALIAQAQTWLLAQQQENGAFAAPGSRLALGVTELSLGALVHPPGLAAADERMKKAIAFILSHKQANGGIYHPDEGLSAYNTAVGLLALQAAGALDAATTKAAQDFLFAAQVTEKDTPSSGGIGYGPPRPAGRADLSNTHLALDALLASGVPASDPRMKEALTYLQHCQNLSSHNQASWVDMSPAQAGSAVYNPDTRPRPAPAGSNAAPSVPAKPTGYASMTYALVSSYVGLGLAAEDERVAAALTWITGNYSPYANPGRAAGREVDGLYYSYWVMSKTFTQLKWTTFTLADGKRQVDWRQDLFAAISFRAKAADVAGKPGVYWLNESKTWGENNPVLVTAYVIEALKRIHATL
jgi:squalene-hopene/tetraprenyl-beta-curcumene cyclase